MESVWYSFTAHPQHKCCSCIYQILSSNIERNTEFNSYITTLWIYVPLKCGVCFCKTSISLIDETDLICISYFSFLHTGWKHLHENKPIVLLESLKIPPFSSCISSGWQDLIQSDSMPCFVLVYCVNSLTWLFKEKNMSWNRAKLELVFMTWSQTGHTGCIAEIWPSRSFLL